MSVARQAGLPGSTLTGFLYARLPQRAAVGREWSQRFGQAPWPTLELVNGRDVLGRAAELRIGLDLADKPGYWDVLSCLPQQECRSLLECSGFIPVVYDSLPAVETTDPILLNWERSWQPLSLDDAQRDSLALSWEVASVGDLARSFAEQPVQVRRSFFSHVRGYVPDSGDDARRLTWAQYRDAGVNGLAHLWEGYLRHGRRQLAGIGERVVLAPELAGGFGVADLVVGKTLVEIKTAVEPARGVATWLDQILGYVLLDWLDILQLEAAGLYLSWQAMLLSVPIADLLAAACPAATPALSDLRSEFRQEIEADLDISSYERLRHRYPQISKVRAPVNRPGESGDSAS